MVYLQHNKLITMEVYSMKNIFMLSALLMTAGLQANVKPSLSQEEVQHPKYRTSILLIANCFFTNDLKLAKKHFDELVESGFKPLNIAIDVLKYLPETPDHYKKAHTFFINTCKVELPPLNF